MSTETTSLVGPSASAAPASKESKLVGTTKTSSAVVSYFLSFLGLGLLAMPYGFKEAGIIAGVVMLTVVTVSALYAFHIISQSRRYLRERGHTDVKSYGDVGFHAMGRVGRVLVDVFTVMNQIGIMSAYMQYCASEMADLVPELNYRVWMVVLIWVWILLCIVRQYSVFGALSLIGLAGFVLAIVLVLVYGATQHPTFHPVRLPPTQIFLFFGIAALAFAAIAVGMQVETELATPQDYPKMLNGIFVVLFLLYMSFSLIVYSFFGSHTAAIITDNLSGWMRQVTQIALIVQLTIAIPLNGFPIWMILESGKLGTRSYRGPRTRLIVLTIVRVCVVLFAAVIAISVPYFSLFVNLVGAVAATGLTYVLPLLFHLKIMGFSGSLKSYIADLLVLTIGLGVGVITVAVTIAALVAAFQGATQAEIVSTVTSHTLSIEHWRLLLQ